MLSETNNTKIKKLRQMIDYLLDINTNYKEVLNNYSHKTDKEIKTDLESKLFFLNKLNKNNDSEKIIMNKMKDDCYTIAYNMSYLASHRSDLHEPEKLKEEICSKSKKLGKYCIKLHEKMNMSDQIYSENFNNKFHVKFFF